MGCLLCARFYSKFIVVYNTTLGEKNTFWPHCSEAYSEIQSAGEGRCHLLEVTQHQAKMETLGNPSAPGLGSSSGCPHTSLSRVLCFYPWPLGFLNFWPFSSPGLVGSQPQDPQDREMKGLGDGELRVGEVARSSAKDCSRGPETFITISTVLSVPCCRALGRQCSGWLPHQGPQLRGHPDGAIQAGLRVTLWDL
jgi:hypothetical protein